MPLGRALAWARPSRDVCRTVSWLDSTQVVGAPTASLAVSEAVTTRRSDGASHVVVRNAKLKAWCISSGRTYRARRSMGSTQASATSARSPS